MGIFKDYVDYCNGMYKQANLLSRKDIRKKTGDISNMTLVTGFSGSGKTTLVDELERKYPIVNVELDGFQHGYDTSEGEKVVTNFVNKYGPFNEHSDYGPQEIMEYLTDVAKKNPDKHYVVNGVQFLGAPDEVLKQYPIVLKGTGLFKSSHRRLKRDKACGNKGAGENILDAIKYNLRINKDIDRVRRIIKNANEEYSITHSRDKSYKGKNTRHSLINSQGEEVGYAISRPSMDKKNISLSELFILDEHQGKGLSKKIIDDVKNTYPTDNLILRANPYKNKKLSKKQLSEYYKKQGFVDTDNGCMIFKRD